MLTKAQERTIEDLTKYGVHIYIGKDGRIRHLRMPAMDLPSLTIVDKMQVEELRDACKEYLRAPPSNVPARKKFAAIVTGANFEALDGYDKSSI